MSALTGNAMEAVQMITSALTANRSTGATLGLPFHLSSLARAYAELGRRNDATRCIGEAVTQIEKTKEGRYEAEVNRVAGDIALKSATPDLEKAEAYFRSRSRSCTSTAS